MSETADIPRPASPETTGATPDAPLAGDRGISPVAGRIGFGRIGQATGVAALAAGCGLFLLATAHHPAPPKRAVALAPARQVVTFEPAGPPPTLDHPGPDAPGLGPEASPPDGAGPVAGAQGPSPRARPDGAAGAVPTAVPPILAYSRGANSPPAPPRGDAVGSDSDSALPTNASGAAASATASVLDPLRRAGPIGRARAQRLPDRSFMILAGTSIPCVLQTALDTSTPGYVSCVIPSDVWSENGALVLLEKGSKVLGEYRGGLRQGQARIFVAWTRAITPSGVSISLSSPASDAVGRAGFDGVLDTHFWQRFGGAVLLSVIEDGLAAASRNSDGVTLQAPSQAADTALKSSIDIPPTLRKAPGAQVAIFAAEDFDFSAVYGVAGR